MGDQVKGFSASLGIHAGLLVLMLALTANAVKYAPPISIDFTLSSCPVPEPLQEKQKTPVAVPKQTAMAPPQTHVQQEQARPEPQPSPVVSQYAAPMPIAPPAIKTLTEYMPRQVTANPATPAVAVAPRIVQTGEEKLAPEKAQQRYLKEHFIYIRDLIVQRLIYPQIARRMGWSGRVVLAFVVAENGSVRSIHVKESSGYAALDNSAMETVKSVAPFPKPPVAAEIVMPVHFRLQ